MAAGVSEVPPIVFLSHASEDKESFAEPLGRALARLGLQPWLDKWEIKPGDSLVQKIFDEGLARSQAVVVIISEVSVTKPWVREELDSATVSRIQRGTKLIPIRLDKVEMPEPLAHLAWIDAERTPESVDYAATRIADAVHERELRPAVGAKPTYLSSPVRIAGLSTADSVLLTEIIKLALEEGDAKFLSLKSIKERAEQLGVSESVFNESLHALKERYYVSLSTYASGDVYQVELTRSGYLAGVSSVVPDVEEVHLRLLAALVNNPPTSLNALAELMERTGAERLVADQFLRELELRGLVKATRFIGGGARIYDISPTLRRLLD